MLRKTVLGIICFLLLLSLFAQESNSDFTQGTNLVQKPDEYHFTFPYDTESQVKGFINPEKYVVTDSNWYLLYACIPHITPAKNGVYGLCFGLPFIEGINSIYGLDLGLSGYVRNVYGIQISGLVNNNYNAVGLQMALINSIQENSYGLEIGGSNAGNYMIGFQIGAINTVKEYLAGMQVGLVNDVIGDIHGTQLGLINVADDIGGMQVALVNRAKNTTGFNFQLGLINSNDFGASIQIGLINYDPEAWLTYFPIINFSYQVVDFCWKTII